MFADSKVSTIAYFDINGAQVVTFLRQSQYPPESI